MNLQAHGITATLESDGVLNIVTDGPVIVRLNGRILNGGPASVQPERRAPATQFWTAEGRQTADRPVDLRGEN